MKFFLIGWICLGVGIDEKCVRMGSEVIHPSYELCNEYYTIIREEFSDVKDLKMSFTCVQAGLLEDLL
jgi:hypothetical protein